WGGGWLAAAGAADFSGGYVIHLAAASSGFVAAAMVGPRLKADRDHFPPNNLLTTLVGAGILWLSMNKLQKTKLMMKVDDTLSVFSTHGVAGLMGGLLVGVLANPDMLVYIGTDKEAPGVNVTGWLYGNPGQFVLQAEGAGFII